MTAALLNERTIRSVTFPNRIVISPMQQYMAGRDGLVRDWHFVHLTKMAVGGAGTVFTEALATEPEGRVTYHDLGVWSDDHLEGLKRVAGAIGDNGAVPAAQLIHAGRKASVAPPYHGFEPLGEKDEKERGEAPWPVVAAISGVRRRNRQLKNTKQPISPMMRIIKIIIITSRRVKLISI